MADQIDSQAKAATEPSPTTAAGNNTDSQPVQTAAETTVNHQPNPTEAPDVDVAGMDAAAYADWKEKIARGELPEEKSPAVAQEPTSTDDPPTEGKTPEGEPAKVETEPTEEAKKAEEEEDKSLTPDRIRLTDLEEHERLAVKLFRDGKKSGKPISMAEAEKRARAAYGIPDTTEQAPASTDNATPEQPTTATGLEAHIKSLRDQYRQAAKDVDTERMATIQEQIDTARDQLDAARESERAAEEQELTALNAAKTELREKYPDFAKKDSPLAKKWTEIHAKLEAEDHPILSKPAEATRYITFLAAEELGIQPVKKGATVPAKASPSTPATTQQKQPPVQPVSGAARTTTPTDATGQIEKRIADARTLDEYERLKNEMLSPANAA
jgi:hypothetical protein